MRDLHIRVCYPFPLYRNNKSAINVAANQVQHDKTKHTEIDHHFVGLIFLGQIGTIFVPFSKQLVDILTKGVSKAIFENALFKLSVSDIDTLI